MEGMPWIFKIPRDKPCAWPEIKILSYPIKMKTHSSQEENCHAMWDTTGRTNLTKVKLPRLSVVPYAVVEWLSKRGQTSNELRAWSKEMTRTDVNSKREDWELFFAFSMTASQMDPNDKQISILDMEVEPVTSTDPKCWK